MFHTFIQNEGDVCSSLEMITVAARATLLLIIASMACWLFRRDSAAIRHRIWTLGVVSTLLIPLICSLLPRLSLAILPPASVDLASDSQPFGPPMPLEMRRYSEQPVSSTEFVTGTKTGDRVAVDEPQRLVRTVSGESTDILTSAATSAVEQEASPDPLLWLWGIGSAIVFLPFLSAVALQWLRHRDLEAIADPEWTAAIRKLSTKIRPGTPVKAYAADFQRIPAVYGAIFPYLVLPIDWRKWSETQLECVLLHEMAHMKRRDVAAQYLGRIAAAAYWFNPLAWYALRQLRIERESACDDAVLQTGTRASDYASQLLHTCRKARWSPMNLGVAMTHSTRLDDRIVAILDGTRCRVQPNRRVCRMATFLMLFLTIAIGVPVLVAKPALPADGVDESQRSGQEAQGPTVDSIKPRKHETMTFRGQVLHGSTPIEGATISLHQRFIAEGFYKDWHPREILDIEPRIVALSGTHGEFEFRMSTADLVDTPRNIWPNPWELVQVVASKDGMGVGWCKVRELSDRRKIWIRNTVPVHGRVLDLEGQPVVGADIRVLAIQGQTDNYDYLAQPHWTGLSRNIVTDDSGRFTIVGLPTNTKDIRLYAQGDSIATKIFRIDLADKETSVEVIVEPTKPVTGTIVDVDSGQPVAGAVVYGDDERMRNLVRTISNERGEYRLLGLPKSKNYKLTVRSLHPGPYLTRYSNVADTPGLTPLLNNMTIRKGVPVHVKVIDKYSRELLYPELHYSPTSDHPNYRESSRELYHPSDQYRDFHAADADGIVRFYAYPGRGLIDIRLQGSGGYLPVGTRPDLMEHARTDITFGFSMGSHAASIITPKISDAPLDVTLEADPGETMAIRLVDDVGKPVEGASGVNQYFNAYFNEHDIAMMDRHGKSGPHYGTGHGTQIEGNVFTVYMLESRKPRLLVFTHPERRLMAMTTGDPDQPVKQVILKPWATVMGRLLDANGNALPNVEVAVNYPSVTAEGDWPLQPTGKTDALGRLAIDRLIPGVEHTLTVTGMNTAMPDSMKLIPSPGETIDLKDLTVHPRPQSTSHPSN